MSYRTSQLDVHLNSILAEVKKIHTQFALSPKLLAPALVLAGWISLQYTLNVTPQLPLIAAAKRKIIATTTHLPAPSPCLTLFEAYKQPMSSIQKACSKPPYIVGHRLPKRSRRKTAGMVTRKIIRAETPEARKEDVLEVRPAA
jgi:hypothetical protein